MALRIGLILAGALSIGLIGCGGGVDFYGNSTDRPATYGEAAPEPAVAAPPPSSVAVQALPAPQHVSPAAPPEPAESQAVAEPAPVMSIEPTPRPMAPVAVAEPPPAAVTPMAQPAAESAMAPAQAVAVQASPPVDSSVSQRAATPPARNTHCEEVAKQRAGDASFAGEDETTQKMVYDSSYASCADWDARHGS